ncbi:hypothetical protein [Ligilactobacillus equi]|uniref:Uncharacterized protein n=1 Tax=Ligilactobacillus equi DPC 6820 TaxID=1392007 RepID=V7HZU0_9LACO|nr:hypothetical protein [Ligilactobacillus equi]ETA74536.1 hypothetical protein LEQ_0401 [Ligilactobacillus equi DPC 6820]
MNTVEFIEFAALESRGSMDQWFRYLRKVIFEDYTKITKDDLEQLLKSPKLNNFQKVSLKRGVTKGTVTFDYIVSQNKPNQKENVKRLLKLIEKEEKEKTVRDNI